MTKRKRLEEVEGIARAATQAALGDYRHALEGYPKSGIYLETQFDDEAAAFDLCWSGSGEERVVLARTVVSRLTGEITSLEISLARDQPA